MKRLKFLIFSILMMFALYLTMPINSVAFAETRSQPIDYRINIEAILKDFVSSESRQNRYACGENEHNAALYIAEKMTSYGFTAVNNQSTKNGFQSFDVRTNKGLYTSKNVIFQKQGSDNTKKIVLATHYDTNFIYDYTEENEVSINASEGVSDSGAGVASLLFLSQLLSYENLDYTVEVVFFGAHYNNMAGSAYYTSFISSEDASNVLLMINFDHLIGDGFVYLYNGEFENSTDEYVYNTFSKNFNTKKLIDYSVVSDTMTESVTGLNYTNFALESDNAHFIRVGIKTLSPVVISEDCVSNIGVIDYKPMVSILSDNISKINEKTDGRYLNNISLVVNGCMNLLTDVNFKINMQNSKLSNMYNVLGDEKMMVFIAFVLLIVIIFVYLTIKQNLEKKALEARESLNLDKVIATINPKDLEDMDSLVDRLTAQFEEESKQLEEKQKKEQEQKEKNNSDSENNSSKEDKK